MDEVQKLEHLSLVSKVCTELENHLGMNDKDLAEFIIHLSQKHNTLPAFKKVLAENGAEFSDSFVENLLRIIQHMRPSLTSSGNPMKSNPEASTLAEKFPGLAIPNEPQIPLGDGDDKEEEKTDQEREVADKEIVDDLMAQFEAEAPSNVDSKKEEKRRRSRSHDRQQRRRDGSRTRERNRSRSRDRNRNRHRDRRRDRSRSRHRRSSNDRSRRSRSRERRRSRERNRSRERDRNRDSMDRHVKKENLELDDDPVPGKVNLLGSN